MSMRDSDKPLLAQHAALIEASAISDQVAQARGYRSATTKAELARLGFGEAQRRVPALLIPVWNVRGDLALHQIRPDVPRMRKDRPVKYETPHGARMVLDVHPFARLHIGDPNVPLFITEGIRKADAAVTLSLCCIGLLGVWNWRGTNQQGGTTALPDWESIALKDRDVYVAFDSDVMTKPEVQDALRRLKNLLEGRRARVRLIYLPPASNGAKQGLDDFIAAGGRVEDLLRLSSETLREPQVRETDDTVPYLVANGRICIEKQTQHGPVVEPLCNFDARIVEETSRDDGQSVSREFLLSGSLASGRSLSAVRVAVDRFASMSWLTSAWGVDAVLAAGYSKRDQLREAILRLSREVNRRTVYTHTGWRNIDGNFYYLTRTGAPGRRDLEVDLSHELQRFALPSEPVDVAEAMRRSLDLLRIAPLTVTAPLWAAVYRAPLASLHPVDLTVWLEGISGSLKSSLAAVFQSHWGEFDRKHLPADWSSTANLLEKRAYVLKDALFVVDDFAPNPITRRDLEAKAARLVRSQGNASGRGRLQSDLSEARTFAPRGLLLSTGEERPPMQSLLARTFLLDLARDQVDLVRLTEAQRTVDRLAHAMAGYVMWLAPQMGTLGASLHEGFERARHRADGIGNHLRHPEALAHLWIGIDCGLSFAVDANAISMIAADQLRAECWDAMVERAGAMARFLEDERPTRCFAETLATLLVQRRVVILRRDHGRPEGPRDGKLIGWFDSEFLYLLPSAAFQAVSQFARDSGEGFPVSRRRLWQDLVREHIAQPSEGRATAVVRIGGVHTRVLRLRTRALAELVGSDFPLPEPSVTGVTGYGEEGP